MTWASSFLSCVAIGWRGWLGICALLYAGNGATLPMARENRFLSASALRMAAARAASSAAAWACAAAICF